jgi:hypothetical protein
MTDLGRDISWSPSLFLETNLVCAQVVEHLCNVMEFSQIIW